jgi:hypothetical protein
VSKANSWKDIEVEIERIVGESESPFDPETVSNVRDFLRLARDCCPTPTVSKGYWNTILFDWGSDDGRPLQIEVFADHTWKCTTSNPNSASGTNLIVEDNLFPPNSQLSYRVSADVC